MAIFGSFWITFDIFGPGLCIMNRKGIYIKPTDLCKILENVDGHTDAQLQNHIKTNQNQIKRIKIILNPIQKNQYVSKIKQEKTNENTEIQN